ncbi:MAG: hypothetical protein LBF41_03510 [Deltaproteobacteria bacterium]|nr:hypothetical protein [Deltaproteobacteria bacterium]
MKSVKAFISALLVFAMTLGLVGIAKAESPVSFSGFLRLRAFALGGFFDTDPKSGESVGDKYADTRFALSMVFKPSDNVEVLWGLHAPTGARWGGDFTDFRTTHAFGRVRTTVGTFSAGRVTADIDSAGLASLGYSPSWGFSSLGNVFDTDSEKDGVMFSNEWANGFGIKAYYVKRSSVVPTPANHPKDADWNRYSFEPRYEWNNGGVALAVTYDDDKRADIHKNWIVSVNPAVALKFQVTENAFLAFHLEAKYSSGEYQLKSDSDSSRQTGFGAYADATVEYPGGDATVAGWYLSGNDEGVLAKPVKKKNLVGAGQGFYPFFIFNQNFVTPGTFVGLGGASDDDYRADATNLWAVALLGNHAITENVTLNYGVGHFSKVADYFVKADVKASKKLGTEFDLGVTAKFSENISYSTKVGYFIPGAYHNDRHATNEYKNDVWGWANELVFSF